MTAGDWIIGILVLILLVFALHSIKKGRKSCDGNCSRCQSGCSSLDWDKIREEIHSGR